VSAGSGEIFVKVQNGFELKEIHDVDLITTSPINGHVLGFNGTLWVNKTVAGWLGFTPEPAIAAGTTSQYWRGDKSWQTLDKIAVGLGNVDNTSDANKPISTATQAALNAKFTLPTLTAGSILFSDGATIAQNNANLFWDNTNGRLGIGTDSPAYGLDVNTTLRVTGFSHYTAYFTAVQRLQFNNGTTITNFGLITASGNGIFRLVDSSEANFGRLCFGGGTTAFPALQRSGVALCVVDGTGTGLANLLIGTTTNAGYKLDVNGSAKFGDTNRFVFNSSGMSFLTSGGSIANFPITAGSIAMQYSVINVGSSGYNQSIAFSDSWTRTIASTSFGSQTTFNPTSGVTTFSSFSATPVINQTGGANGITRGLYIAPTLTAAADFRAIEVASGITILGAATTAKASLRIPSGTAPTSPVNGDIWFDGTDIKMRIGGVTKTFTLL
jgi:hypothetical protein